MSCLNPSPYEPAAKVMLSDVEGQKVVSLASMQPSGGSRRVRPWVVVAAIAVACIVVGVAVGVPVGLAVNKKSKQPSPQQVPVLFAGKLRWGGRRVRVPYACTLNTYAIPYLACTSGLRASPGRQRVGPVGSLARLHDRRCACPQCGLHSLGKFVRPCCAPPNWAGGSSCGRFKRRTTSSTSNTWMP